MAEKKKFKKKELQELVEEFVKKENINKSKLTLDWMDAYVAKLHPEKIDEYAKKCASFAMNENGKDNKKRIDVKAIRNYFINEFFPTLTDEALKAKKEAEKAEREAEKAKKKELTPEEIIARKLKALSEEED